MSDFNTEIDDAINGVTSPEPADPVTTVVTPAVALEKGSRSSVEEDVLSIMEGPRIPKPKEEEEEVVVSKEEKKTDKVVSKEKAVSKEKVEGKEVSKETTSDPQDKKTAYLDRFLKEDAEGNLVLADGTVVASAGPSRTYYEALKKEGREVRAHANKLAISNIQLGQQFKNLYTQFEELKKTSPTLDIEKETGMNSSEVQRAMYVMKNFKLNPVQAIKTLLTEAKMNGIDLSSIGVDGGIDPAVVQRAIQEAVKEAQTVPETQKNSEQELYKQAEQEALDFLKRNPQAEAHTDVLAKAKDKFPEKSLDELWVLYKIHMQKEAAKADEESFNSSIETLQKEPVKTEKRATTTKVVTPPNRNYATMSFQDIANSIREEL